MAFINTAVAGIMTFLSGLPNEMVSDFYSKNKYEGYELVWSDNFFGEKLNEEFWNYEEGYKRNDELQYYSKSENNVYLSDGKLYLVADREKITDDDANVYDYTSGSVKTKNKFSFREGILEMRAKLPKGKGMWPGFWVRGDVTEEQREKYPVSWPYAGEIDIMELVGGEYDWGGNGDAKYTINVQWGTLPDGERFSLNKIKGTSYTCPFGIFNDDFHVFGIKWIEDSITWFCDGTEFYTYPITDDMVCYKEVNQYIILNLAVGGSWAGEPDEETVFPNEYIIDWVRLYQKEENVRYGE